MLLIIRKLMIGTQTINAMTSSGMRG